MGQKTNPIGNRLGIIRGWESSWYGGNDYGDKLAEDDKIRKYVQTRLSKASVAHVIIERTFNLVTVTITTARPGIIIGKGGQEVDKLKEELKKMYTSSKLIFEQEGSNNFLKLLTQILIVNAMAGSLIALYNLYLLDNPIFQLSFSQSLLVLQTTLVLAIIAASLTPNDYFSRLSLNQLTLWAALTMILLAVSNFLHLPVFVGIAFGFLLAYISGKINPKINTLLLSKLPSDVLAQTSSFLSLLFSFSVPFGTMVFSSLALWNMNASWLIFSFIGVIALLLSIEKKKDVNER